MKTKKIEIYKKLTNTLTEGVIEEIEVDDNGVPIKGHWRSLLAAGHIGWVIEKTPKKKQKGDNELINDIGDTNE